jgi:hypothetical protein
MEKGGRRKERRRLVSSRWPLAACWRILLTTCVWAVRAAALPPLQRRTERGRSSGRVARCCFTDGGWTRWPRVLSMAARSGELDSCLASIGRPREQAIGRDEWDKDRQRPQATA